MGSLSGQPQFVVIALHTLNMYPPAPKAFLPVIVTVTDVVFHDDVLSESVSLVGGRRLALARRGGADCTAGRCGKSLALRLARPLLSDPLFKRIRSRHFRRRSRHPIICLPYSARHESDQQAAVVRVPGFRIMNRWHGVGLTGSAHRGAGAGPAAWRDDRTPPGPRPRRRRMQPRSATAFLPGPDLLRRREAHKGPGGAGRRHLSWPRQPGAGTVARRAGGPAAPGGGDTVTAAPGLLDNCAL
eukprot:246225-Hanusia_phi.AAC.1